MTRSTCLCSCVTLSASLSVSASFYTALFLSLALSLYLYPSLHCSKVFTVHMFVGPCRCLSALSLWTVVSRLNENSSFTPIHRRQFPMATLVVNTPGWVKGMGLVLLGDIIRVTRPRLVRTMHDHVSLILLLSDAVFYVLFFTALSLSLSLFLSPFLSLYRVSYLPLSFARRCALPHH